MTDLQKIRNVQKMLKMKNVRYVAYLLYPCVVRGILCTSIHASKSMDQCINASMWLSASKSFHSPTANCCITAIMVLAP
jgi:hypothetical protein